MMKHPLPFTKTLSRIAGAFALALAIPVSQAQEEDGWISLFNGKDLEGWTVKVAKHPLGENPGELFRVEDGIMKVSYDEFGTFDSQFAHIFTNNAYSNYILRLDYLFTGTAVEDAQHWAKLNSGVMVHSQSPLSMSEEQGFPVSMEFQFLANDTTAGTQTGNACTPGTNVVMNGELVTDHIIDATSRLYPLEEWVSAEIEVRGGEEIIHRVNGKEVLRYQTPQLDPSDSDAQALLDAGMPMRLSQGHIALQAESQPVWFRNIQIRVIN